MLLQRIHSATIAGYDQTAPCINGAMRLINVSSGTGSYLDVRQSLD